MLRVGVTGGIGAGKSSVVRRLSVLGAEVIDADAVARDVVRPGEPALADLRRTFGPRIVASDGGLDRAALAEIMFADPQRRAQAEAILHPAIRERTRDLVAALPDDTILVHEVPLLVENGMAGDYHLVVVVAASVPARLERLTRTRGMATRAARDRIAAQADDATRAEVADVELRNDGTPGELDESATTLWRRLVAYRDNLLLGRPATFPAAAAARPHDLRWERWGAATCRRLRAAAERVAPSPMSTPAPVIAHVGATALAGAPATPVLDVWWEVQGDVPPLPRLRPLLADAGFVPRGDAAPWAYPGAGWAAADPERPALLAVTSAGDAPWPDPVRLRDHLRQHPDRAAALAAAKASAPADAYRDVKRRWLDAECVALGLG